MAAAHPLVCLAVLGLLVHTAFWLHVLQVSFAQVAGDDEDLSDGDSMQSNVK